MKVNEYKNIQELCSFLVGDFVDLDFTENDIQRQKYFDKIPYFKEKLGENSSFFFGNNHDSSILQLNKIDDDYDLILNDCSTISFASAYADIKGIQLNKRKFNFPCKIKFNKIKHFSSNTVSESGSINREKKIKSKNLSEYLYEEFISIDTNEIQLLLNVWMRHSKNRNNQCLILIICEDISIEHELKNNWLKLFGNESLEIFNQYFKLRNEGKFFADYTVCYNYIKAL